LDDVEEKTFYYWDISPKIDSKKEFAEWVRNNVPKEYRNGVMLLKSERLIDKKLKALAWNKIKEKSKQEN
jgi:hypothetical protein